MEIKDREDWRMHRHHHHHEDWNPKSKIILAVLLICAGVLLLANNFNIIPYFLYHTIFSWPMLLIVIGVIQLAKHPNKTFGLVLMAVGAFFLIPRVFPVSVSFGQLFWPAIFLGIGVLILVKGSMGNKCWKKGEFTSSEMIDEVNIFGGTERRITTKNFRGGETVAIFGGSVYDFTEAELAEGKNVIEVVNIFGGSKFIIPSSWNVHIEVVSIFGGFADKRKSGIHLPENLNRELYIKGVAFFGGGEIKSF
jgi:predicted membrane protein